MIEHNGWKAATTRTTTAMNICEQAHTHTHIEILYLALAIAIKIMIIVVVFAAAAAVVVVLACAVGLTWPNLTRLVGGWSKNVCV